MEEYSGEEKCVHCNGAGESSDGSYEHPETGSSGRYALDIHECPFCEGTGKRWRFFVGGGRFKYSAAVKGSYIDYDRKQEGL